MPQLPSQPLEFYQSQTSPVEPMRRIVPSQSPSPVGASIENFAEGAQAAVNAQGAAYAARSVAQAQDTWTQEMQQRKANAAPGAPGFTGQTLNDYDKYASDLVSKAPRGPAQHFLNDRLMAYREQISHQANAFEIVQRTNNNVDSLNQHKESAVKSILSDPSNFLPSLAEHKELINQMVLEPDQKQKLFEDAQSAMSRASVYSQIKSNPLQAQKELMDAATTNPAIKALTADDKIDMFARADSTIRQRISDYELNQRIEEQKRRQQSDAILKNGIQLASQNKLSSKWIEQYHAVLEPSSYKYLYDQVEGGKSGQTNVIIYSNLRDQVSRGMDVRDDAKTALLNGQIEKGDYNTLVSESEKERPNWYKRGAQFISESAAVSQLNPDPAAAQRKAMMLDDWQQWSDDHPKATESDATGQYKRLVSEYALIDAQKFTISMRTPTYLIGTRNSPNIDATEDATVKAFQAHQIDDHEFARQAQLISQWRESLDKMKQHSNSSAGSNK